jgi:GT2 family glycosyltransferase
MKVLIIIVSYNGMEWIERCLGSALKASASKAVQADVFVVDNCSSDGTPERIEKDFPKVKLVKSESNMGFGAANNLGLEYALEHGYDYAYLLNQDAWLLPDTLSLLLDAAESAWNFAILSPLQMQADGVHFDTNFEKRALNRKLPEPLYEVPRVMAAHWLIRLSALKEVGLFAPIFPHYGEDDNLCDRFRAAGWKIGVVSGAKAIHDRAFRKEPKEKLIRRNYYVKSLVDLCNPLKPLWRIWPYIYIYTLVKAIRYRSIEPFRYLCKIKSQKEEILKTRRTNSLYSTNKC